MIGLLIFGLVILSTVFLWILIEERKSWKFLVWFIPILLVIVTSTYVTYTSILGFPKPGIPKQGMYLKPPKHIKARITENIINNKDYRYEKYGVYNERSK